MQRTEQFRSTLHRLLGSTTETNCTVFECSSLRCRPSHIRVVYHLKLSVADNTKDITDIIENHALLSLTFGLFEESYYCQLVVRSAHCRCLDLQDLVLNSSLLKSQAFDSTCPPHTGHTNLSRSHTLVLSVHQFGFNKNINSP